MFNGFFMKRIFFLLFVFNISFSQKIENLTRIEYSKAYNEATDCSCNIFRDSQYANVVKEEILDCENLVLELIKYKKKLIRLKSIKACCPTEKGVWNLGCESYYNRLIYQFNKFSDTIYFNNDDNRTEVYTKYKTYFDDKNLLLNIIRKNIEFSKLNKINLDKAFREYYEAPNDSISIEKINISNFNLYSKKREEISNSLKIENNYEYSRDYRDSLGIYTLFSCRKDSFIKIIIRENQSISSFEISPSDDCAFDEFNYFIDNIRTNDKIEKLVSKYPNSTKHIENLKKYFKNKTLEYDYEILINLINNFGNVIFQIKDGLVNKITVNYKYK